MSTTDTVQRAEAIDPGFVTLQRATLVTNRASYVQERDRLSAAAVELLNDWSGRDGGGDDDFGEGDSVEVELDRIRALLGVISTRIEDVDAALARLDADRYGICDSCRQAIAPARLEVMPESTHCVSCKSGSGLGLSRRLQPAD